VQLCDTSNELGGYLSNSRTKAKVNPSRNVIYVVFFEKSPMWRLCGFFVGFCGFSDEQC